MTDSRVGKYYYVSGYRNIKPIILYVYDIKHEPSYYAKVYYAITSIGGVHKDKAVMLSYYREATETELLLYWPEKIKKGADPNSGGDTEGTDPIN